jgi:succinate dehydrogenase/fumarate reductase cytochrome b subunit
LLFSGRLLFLVAFGLHFVRGLRLMTDYVAIASDLIYTGGILCGVLLVVVFVLVYGKH